MTKNLLDLSGKIDQQSIDLFRLINRITAMLDMPYLVVGATARDIVYHHRFGTPVKRATTDIDFGIQVRSWEEFESLSQMLVSEEFKATKSAHRFFSPNDTQLDIVPFGLIEDEMANIQWPPNGDVEMNVLGFKEALDHSFQVKIASDPELHIPVASPRGLVMLKFIAWDGREREMRVRDAQDIAYLLNYYEVDKSVLDRVYEGRVIEQYDYDVSLASAHILGSDSTAIAGDKTRKRILEIIDRNLNSSDENLLVVEMCKQVEMEYEKYLKLLQAFASGFR